VAFWNRKKNERRLETHRAEVGVMCVRLLDASGTNFDTSSPLEQALIGTFYFGMLQTHGMLHQLSAPDIHALALIAYKEHLHYSDKAAAQAVQECINATQPGYHDTMNAILHRGIDGHRQYIAHDFSGLSDNIQSILKRFRK
jgi:hypothetical protein